MGLLLFAVPADRDLPLGVRHQTDGVGAIRGVDRHPPTAGDEADDLIPGDRTAALGEMHQDVVDSPDAHPFLDWPWAGGLSVALLVPTLLRLGQRLELFRREEATDRLREPC
jgi:hypothetical protein